MYSCESIFKGRDGYVTLFPQYFSPPGNIVRRITPYTAWEELPYRERQGWQNRGGTRKNMFEEGTPLR